MGVDLGKRVKNATKWSALTELLAKVLTPVVSMVLARILNPEAFGIVTTIAMIISFAEIFTDAGFQKYLIQHEFINNEDKVNSANVAFWSNLVLSFFLWLVIAAFSNKLAALVGNPGLGHVLVVSCASIPLAAFSSIQIALLKRDFDFKTLFKVRIVSIFIPLFITIPLAVILRSFWALVIGTLFVNASNALLLMIYGKWKPIFSYDYQKLKRMLSFTIWSIIEQISIWLTSYVDVFIVGTMLNQYYLGLYKTTSALVGQIMGLVTAITTPVLFSALSRLQDEPDNFKHLFFKFQKLVGLLVIPLGFGVFLFSDIITSLLLGDQWSETSGFIGLWALTSGFTVVLSHYASEVYRAKGLPKLSVMAQFLHIVVLWPVVLISVKYGFEVLYKSRSLVRLEMILVNLMILHFVIKISPIRMIFNILPSTVAAICMCFIFFIFPNSETLTLTLIKILVCLSVYVFVVSMFKNERLILLNLKTFLINRKV